MLLYNHMSEASPQQQIFLCLILAGTRFSMVFQFRASSIDVDRYR